MLSYLLIFQVELLAVLFTYKCTQKQAIQPKIKWKSEKKKKTLVAFVFLKFGVAHFPSN